MPDFAFTTGVFSCFSNYRVFDSVDSEAELQNEREHLHDIKLNESDEAFPNAKHLFLPASVYCSRSSTPVVTNPSYPILLYVILYSTIAKQCITTLIVYKFSHLPLSGSAIPQMHLPSEQTHSPNFSLASWRGRISYLTTIMTECTVSKTPNFSYLAFR